MEKENFNIQNTKNYNYKDSNAMKLTDSFKRKYILMIKGKQAITCEGLKVLAHQKGIKSLTTNILQFPNKDNNNTCIVEAKLIGYDWDPITEKIINVEYTEIGDANPSNCNSMIAPAFIRMAATRATGRVLRNYTNIGMTCSEEIFDPSEIKKQTISDEALRALNDYIITKQISQQEVVEILKTKFNTKNPRALNKDQEEEFMTAVVAKIHELRK